MGASLYDQFHTNVKGVGSLSEASQGLTSQSLVYESVRDNLTQALSGIKATYTGQASDAMSSAFQPVTDSINDGANFAGSASAACDFQSTSFSTAQANITKNVPVPSAPWYEPVDPWNTDHDDAVNQNSQIDSANEAAYNTYGSDTTSNVNFVETASPDSSGFGTFAVQQQGPGTSVGTSSGAPSASGSGSRGSSFSGARGSLGNPGRSGGYASPPSASPGGSGPGGQGVTVPPNSPSGSTTTSGFPGVNPGGSGPGGSGPGGSGPGGGGGSGPGYPGGVNPGGSGGNYPGGSSGGQFGGDGPGGMVGPVGGMGGYSGGSGGASGGFGGGGGSASGLGRGGFGAGAGGESGSGIGGSGSSAGSGARSGAASLGAAGEEGEMGATGGAAGRSGASGMGGMGRGGRGGQDEEHKTAGYLVNEDNGNLIVGDFDPVAPPVIGE